MSTNKASILLLSGAILALPFAAISQTSSGSTSTTTKTSTNSASTTEANRLVAQYATLAGSQQNATSVINGLRNGTQVTLTSSGGKTTAFTPPTGKMGYGEVDISLALAEKLMSANSKLTLSSALMGSGSTQGILQRRASGMGWGQIANSLGFKLGDVMRSAKADSSPGASQHAERPERAERPAHIDRLQRHDQARTRRSIGKS